MTINDIQKLSKRGIVLTKHLSERMRDRGIRMEEIKSVIANGLIVKEEPKAIPFPSYKIQWRGLAVVVSINGSVINLVTTFRKSTIRGKYYAAN